MPAARSTAKRLSAATAVLLALVVVAVAVAVYVNGDTPDAPAARKDVPSTAAVEPGSATTVASADGGLTVEIPAGAVAGNGTVSVSGATGRGGRPGWSVELDGTELTKDATLRFKTPERAEGEPPPAVRYARTPQARPQYARATETGVDELVVHTDHFSFWSLDVWGQVLAETTAWAGDQLDKMASLSSTGKAPRCEGEDQARAAGYKVTSDSGRRVYWCLGTTQGRPVLKVVNGRGYGVAAEYAPGLTVASTDRDAFLDILANLMRPPPTRRVNKVELIPAGNKVEFDLTDGVRTGVMVTPNAGAYLLTAAQFAVETVTMAMRKAGVTTKGAKTSEQHLLVALEAEQCMDTLLSMATDDLDTAADATAFFSDALAAAFDCVAAAVDDIDVGPINKFVVAPLMWLASGLATAANGLVGAVDSFDVDGYQITVTPPAERPTQRVVIDPFTETGLTPGWTFDNALSDSSYMTSCSVDEGSPHAIGPGTHWCGGSSTNACWTSQFNTHEMVCLNPLDVTDRTLTAYPVEDSLSDETEPPAVPEPLFLELKDGSTWWFRTGGAWGGRADDLVGAYGCMNKRGLCGAPAPDGTHGNIILVPQHGDSPTVDRSRPTWRVRVGLLGDPNTDYPPPTWVPVTKAWFITGHQWAGD